MTNKCGKTRLGFSLDGMHGITNFVLPVYGHSDDRAGFHIRGLDTNNSVEELDAMVPSGNMYAKVLLCEKKNTAGRFPESCACT